MRAEASGPGAQTELEAQAAKRFQLLVDSVIDYAIYMLDANGNVASWNTGAQRIKGYSEAEIIGQHFSRFYTEEDRLAGEPARALRIAAAEGRYEREALRVRKDNTRFWANIVVDAIRDENGKLLGFAKVTRDITERRLAQEALEQAQTALMQSQKMEAIGQLTGGVAHDFNNLLTVIVNNLALLSRHVTDSRAQRMIDSAQRAAEQGAKLTQQLLAFARRQPLRPLVHDANVLIRGFEAILRRVGGEAIDSRVLLDSRPLPVLVDGQQFESALLNLAVNACDAMPNGGTLRVRTRMDVREFESTLSAGTLPPGRYAVIAVSDTGTGMTAEVFKRALEPFFTTKEVGKGTGLGLSQVYGFVTQSGGSMHIASVEGKGTTVELFLPLSDAEPMDPAEDSGAQLVEAAPAQTVLIVEDEPGVLEVAVELFRSLGYDVVTAVDAPSALDILNSDQPIDVLFSDVVMPRGVSGIELARIARKLRPGMRILLASGYPMNALGGGVESMADFDFVSKPYRWSELADKLRSG